MAISQISLPKTVGLLGGGQLARMLAHSAQRMGLNVKVLSSNPLDPAAQVVQDWTQDNLESSKSISDFCHSCDLVTVESEFLDLSDIKGLDAKIFPSPKTLGLLRDRKTQKSWLDKMKIPTAPWRSLDKAEDLDTFILKEGLPVVCKKRTHGYDGYGTFILKTKKEVEKFKLESFQPIFFIAEKWIPFQKELAIMIARSKNTSFGWLPLVESFQENSRCTWVKGPLRSSESEKMIRKLSRFLSALNYIGIMGVEFFKTKDGLMVNEIAPRVHNSGHYSMDTPGPSQFDLHWFCGLGLPIKGHHPQGVGFAMVNLLGQESKKIQLPISGDGFVHWYGKQKNNLNRKMGHLNTLERSGSLALKRALQITKRGKY